MFFPSGSDLKAFYSSPLGAVVCRRIREKLLARWEADSSNTALRVVGIGYAGPYLMPFLPRPEDALNRCTLWAIPGLLGGVHWPHSHRNRSLVFSPPYLPFADSSMDRIEMIHGLESVQDPQAFLKECWRVLSPEGKIVLIVPNRMSFWSQSERTPFGFGHPYSRAHLCGLLESARLEPTWESSELYMFPSDNRFVMRISEAIRRVSSFFLPLGGGVWIIEAQKRLYIPKKGTKSPSLFAIRKATSRAKTAHARQTGWR